MVKDTNSDIYEVVYQVFIDHLKDKSDYLVPFLERRMSCEKWLQGELMHVLQQMKNEGRISEFVPEKPYPVPKSGRCDIWYVIQESEIWLELEAIVTNYGSPGKPITNQIDHVRKDAERLKTNTKGGFIQVMFFVYPLAIDGSNDLKWKKNMKRATEFIEILIEPVQIPIDTKDALVIYLSKPK